MSSGDHISIVSRTAACTAEGTAPGGSGGTNGGVAAVTIVVSAVKSRWPGASILLDASRREPRPNRIWSLGSKPPRRTDRDRGGASAALGGTGKDAISVQERRLRRIAGEPGCRYSVRVGRVEQYGVDIFDQPPEHSGRSEIHHASAGVERHTDKREHGITPTNRVLQGNRLLKPAARGHGPAAGRCEDQRSDSGYLGGGVQAPC